MYVTPGCCPDPITEIRHTSAEICGPNAWDWQKVTKITSNQLDIKKNAVFSMTSNKIKCFSNAIQCVVYVCSLLPFYFRVQAGLQLPHAKEWSVVGKRIVSNIPESIVKEAINLMPDASSLTLQKVTRMTRYGEVFYSAEYGKLKTCGYCIEYESKGQFGVVQYYLYCATTGDAVAIIKPFDLHDGFETQLLDQNCVCHIQQVLLNKG